MARKLTRCFPILSLIAGISLLLSACDSGRIYEKYEPLSGYEWAFNDVKTFPVELRAGGRNANVSICIRNTEDYLNSNLWLQITRTDPDGKVISRKLALRLTDPSGRWLGRRVGDIIDGQFLLQDGELANFPKAGTYNFRIQHAMRKDIVQGIMDVGLKIERGE